MTTDAEIAPFLLLSIRGEDAAADDEYQAMMRFAGLDESGMHRIRLTHRSLGPHRSRRLVRGHSRWWTVQRQRSTGVEERDTAPRRIRAAVARRRDRRPGFSVPRVLLRRWHARYGHRCHRRPQLPRTGCRRYGNAHRGGSRGSAVRRIARGVRRVRRTQGGGQFPARRGGAARLVTGLSRAGVPGRRQHLRDPVPPRTGSPRHPHQDRRVQELRLFRARVG